MRTVVLIALVLALAAPGAAQTTYWFHAHDVPVGNVDVVASGLGYMDTNAPTSDTPATYEAVAALGGNLVNPEFITTETFEFVDATVDVYWFAQHPNPLAALCDEAWDVTLEHVAGSATVIETKEVAFPWNPEPVERSASFGPFTMPAGRLNVIINVVYFDCDAAASVLYDGVGFESRIEATGFLPPSTGGGGPGPIPFDIDLSVASAPWYAGQDIRFTASITGDSAEDWSLDVDGDGTPEAAGNGPGVHDVDYAFASSGDFTPTLRAFDTGGAESVASISMNVRPNLIIDGGPYVVPVGEPLFIGPEIFASEGLSAVRCAWEAEVEPLESCNTIFESGQVGTRSLHLTAVMDLPEGSAEETLTVHWRPIVEVVSGADGDGDGVANTLDNCPNLPNSEQDDVDGDGRGDACDPDNDNDLIEDGSDNCLGLANQDQADNDHDGAGDACDADDDNDGVSDADDNCPFVANPEQADQDRDGPGDACDADRDGDGVLDAFDAFPDDRSETRDTDFDGIGDNADADDDGDGVPDVLELEIGFGARDVNSQPPQQLVEQADPAPVEEAPGLGFAVLGLALLGLAGGRRRS